MVMNTPGILLENETIAEVLFIRAISGYPLISLKPRKFGLKSDSSPLSAMVLAGPGIIHYFLSYGKPISLFVLKALQPNHGFTTDFNLEEANIMKHPNQFEIPHIYRYEGESNPRR
jgi:hypothetical protein